MGHVRFKISYSRAAIGVYKAVRAVEVLSLLKVTVYLGIYNMFFFFSLKRKFPQQVTTVVKIKLEEEERKKPKRRRSTWPEHSVKTQRL